MYRYLPPKSSVWGHALRKIPPLQQQQAFDEFLRRAAAEHHFTSGSLTILPRDRRTGHSQAEAAAHFARVLGTPPPSHDFPRLDFAQFSECLRALAAEPVCLADKTCHVLLNGSFVVTRWRVADRLVPTRSRFTLDFGTSPRLTTFLDFESVEQFRAVQQALSDLQLCRLNEKHLKEARRAKPATP